MIGALSSIFAAIIVMSFAYLKFDILIYGKDMDLLDMVYNNYFDFTDKFTREDGLNFAFVLGTESDPRDHDPAYVNLVGTFAEWGFNEEGEYVTTAI